MAKKKEESITAVVRITLSGVWKYGGVQTTHTVRLGMSGTWQSPAQFDKAAQEMKEVFRRQLEKEGAPRPDAKLYMRAKVSVYECEHILN